MTLRCAADAKALSAWGSDLNDGWCSSFRAAEIGSSCWRLMVMAGKKLGK
jgi:hypothetical protein